MFPLIWNFGPELITIGNFPVMYYSLFFASSFLFSRLIFIHIFKAEKQNIELVDKLLLYMMISTTLGARLGHVFFYQWDYFFQNPLEILLPFSFSSSGITFTGFRGLASHGAFIGIFTGTTLFVYQNLHYFRETIYKKSFSSNFLYIADRVALCVALAGCMIRVGNFMNSEIEGIPVKSDYGVIFSRGFAKDLERNKMVKKVSFSLDKKERAGFYKPLTLTIEFDERFRDKQIIEEFLKNEFDPEYTNNHNSNRHILLNLNEQNISEKIKKVGQSYKVTLHILGIIRHPAQLYESFGCLLLFIALFYTWHRKRENLRPGILVSIFMIYIFGMRLVYESIKEGEISFSNEYFSLNTAQALSIPAIGVGLIILIFSFVFVKKSKI